MRKTTKKDEPILKRETKLQNANNVIVEDTPKKEEKPLETAKNALKIENKKVEKAKMANVEKNVEKNITKDVKKTENGPKTQKTNAKHEKGATKVKAEVHNDVLGTVSDEIAEKDSKIKTQYEIDNDNYRTLLAAQRSKQLMVGEIYGVEVNEKLGSVIIAVLWNGVKVMIPDKEYFEPEFDFGKTYIVSPKEEQLRRKKLFASYQTGARVYFIVKGVNKEIIETGSREGEALITCVASRKEAMELLRDIYFFHKYQKSESQGVRNVKIGDIVDANVISVREDQVLVECFGVETRIKASDISDEYVENCKDFLEPGNKLTVKVRKLYVNENKIYLAVTGRMQESSKLIETMMAGSTYRGIVEKYNPVKKNYTIKLTNGVIALVLENNVQGKMQLCAGNRVGVKVTKILDNFVFGTAIKL